MTQRLAVALERLGELGEGLFVFLLFQAKQPFAETPRRLDEPVNGLLDRLGFQICCFLLKRLAR
jgi:hypothetical protein